MRKMLKVIVSSLLLLSGGFSSAFALRADGAVRVEDYGGFDGRWEGSFMRTPDQVFPSTSEKETIPTEIAFSIDGSAVQVFIKLDGKNWSEVKHGQFHIYSYKTNAVIYSITADLGNFNDPTGWVETWNFTLTHKEENSLYAVATRAVNNFDHHSDWVCQRTETHGQDGSILSMEK